MENNIFEQEKKHLKETLSRIKSASHELGKKLESIGKQNLAKLVELRENPETSGFDFYNFLEQIHQENLAFNLKDRFKKLEELKYLEKEPYFSRIDIYYQDDNPTRSFYIGKFGHTEKEPVVVDWRAKIASVYYRYRYPQKNVKYQTPDGEVTADLSLKRTFEIDNEILIRYYNNDLQLDESQIISDKISKRTGGVLEDIIETIQASQMDIIESDPRIPCLVQGCVGSGKSTVAIHKLSHIFFNFPELIKPKNCLLVAKSQILIGYLSTLFPKLGIFDISYKTLRELIINLIFREQLDIKLDITREIKKGYTNKDLENLIKEIEKIHIKTEKNLNDLFVSEEFVSFKSYKYSQEMAPYQNLCEIIEDLEEEVVIQQEELKDKPKSIRAMINKENIKVIRKIIVRLKKQRIDLKTHDLRKLLKKFDIFLDTKLSYENALLYIFTHIQIIGLKKFKKYDYCVVDEGQDFSLLEYMVLKELVMFERLCIFGDLNQGYSDRSHKSWDNLLSWIFKNREIKVFQLDTNYRSTKAIIDLANRTMSPFTNKYLPKSINRTGPEPEIRYLNNREELVKTLFSELEKDINNLDKSVGIISFDESLFEETETRLKSLPLDKDKLVVLKNDLRINYIPKGIYLSMFEDCKGLEFSKVYVLGLDPNNIRDFSSAKKAFVVLTRAMNDLKIYCVK